MLAKKISYLNDNSQVVLLANMGTFFLSNGKIGKKCFSVRFGDFKTFYICKGKI
jgi:hypothetical protein